MVALILAAGEGSRMGPLTDGPKSLLPLNGKAIIDHQLEAIGELGVECTVIVVGFRGDLFNERYGDRDDIVLVVNPFFDRTNVLASVWFARQHLGGGFFYFHADTYFEPSILLELAEHPGDVVLAVNRKETVPEDMKVRTAKNRIVEINKQMPCGRAAGEFTGVAKVGPAAAPVAVERVRHRIEGEGRHDDFFETVLQDLIDGGWEVHSLDIGDRISIEMDFPEDYHAAREMVEDP